MAKQYIKIRGANEHNLKNLSVDIPRDELVVLTGLSGSGKSSLAFDTIYAEGQRRYMESLSSYARQFLGQMEKPDVESIEGLSPAISIDQKSTNRNPRSTVGTVTEIYDYMRLLYARVGIPHCPKCGKEIRKQTVDQMVDQILALPERTKIQLLAPVVRGRKGEHVKILDQARRSGYVRVRIDGNLYELSEEIRLEKNIKHNIEIVVDRLIVRPGIEKRLTDSIESVLALSGGFTLLVLWLCGQVGLWLRFLAETILCFQLLATRSLKGESMKVYKALKAGDLEGARCAVSMIVGRDTQRLDEAGKLENTLIVATGDHIPYSDVDVLEELAGKPFGSSEDLEYLRESAIDFDVYKNTLIMWSASMDEPVEVDKVCCQVDILPTVSNLLGLEYDSRMLAGSDILSDSEGLVVFSSRCWKSDRGFYNRFTQTFTPAEGVTMTAEEQEEYVSAMRRLVSYKLDSTDLIIENDFYDYVFGQSGA